MKDKLVRIAGRGGVCAAVLLAACSETDLIPVEGGGAPPPEENQKGGGAQSMGGSGAASNKATPGTVKIADNLNLSWSSSVQTVSGWSTTVTGSMSIQAGAYTFPLANGNVKWTTDGKGGIAALTGSAQISMPVRNTFSGFGLNGSVIQANLGYDTGANLRSLGLPLAPERKYIYLKFTAGFSSSFGTGPFMANTSQETTMVIDHLDPGFLFAGPMGNISAIGLSEQSQIPFSAETTWGFNGADNDFPTFRGQSFIAGEVSLEEFPITVSGDVTSRFIGWDGKGALDKAKFEQSMGINGSFNVGWDFLDGLFRLEVPLSKASMYLDVSTRPFRSAAAISGTAGTSTFLPSWIPATFSENGYMAGYMDTGDKSRNHLDVAAEMTVHSSTLGNAIGIPMSDLPLSQASMHVDRRGFRMRGVTNSAPIPFLVTDNVTVTACFGGDPVACMADDPAGTPVTGSKDWMMRLQGTTKVVGVPMISSTTSISPHGFSITSTYRTGAGQDIAMVGSVTTGLKVSVTGTANVTLGLNEGNKFLEAGAGVAVCGYQKVADAAKCGFDTLTKTDEFHCGKPHCHWSWKHGLRCDAIHCSIKVAKSCDDLTKPINCPPQPINLGSVSGSIAVTIDNNGIGGKFSGKFCAPGGSCTNLSTGGSVDFSSIGHPRFCINTNELPGNLPAGKFCVAF